MDETTGQDTGNESNKRPFAWTANGRTFATKKSLVDYLDWMENQKRISALDLKRESD